MVVPPTEAPPRPAGPRHPSVGVYLHVPFCSRICPYCDFAVVAARTLPEEVEDRTVAGLEAELAERAPAFAGRRLASVYFGGGTPSLLHPESVARLLEAVRRAFPPRDEDEPAPEVTLEVNPDTVDRARLPGFRTAGVGRLSIGIQSLDDAMLKRLGRAHRAREGPETVAVARAAGFDSLSLDLLYGGPGARREGLEAELDGFLALEPDHLSAYELTVEAGTPFALARERGQLDLPGEEEAVAMLERVPERLEQAGLFRYELSSHARPGHEARHNGRYWRREPVLGLGMGAWSSDPARPGAPHGIRRANPRRLEAWLDGVEAEGPAREVEVLAPATARGEAVFLALRTRAGLAAADFEAEFGAPPRAFFDEEIETLCAHGLLDEGGGGGAPADLALTRRGRILSDTVFAHFVEGTEGAEGQPGHAGRGGAEGESGPPAPSGPGPPAPEPA